MRVPVQSTINAVTDGGCGTPKDSQMRPWKICRVLVLGLPIAVNAVPFVSAVLGAAAETKFLMN